MSRETPHDPFDRMHALARELRHLQQEHLRETPGGSTRRRLRARMADLAGRFERLAGAWAADDAERAAWIQFLRGRRPPPPVPRLAAPPLFKGVTDATATVELRRDGDGFHVLLVDGAVLRRDQVRWSLEPDAIEPIRIGGHACREVFDAPREAVAALEAFLTTPGAAPPRAWARALFEDGLIDADFALTPRGQRRLARIPPARSPRIGVVVADAARARVLVLEATHGAAPTAAPLVEVAQLTAPTQRTRDRDQYRETRPGLRREGPHGPGHAVSDRRDGHRRSEARRLAQDLVGEAARAWRELGLTRLVVVASPPMLGLLRPLLAAHRAPPHDELPRDLTPLPAPALHAALAAAGLVPPRRRLPPRRPPRPGVPVPRP